MMFAWEREVWHDLFSVPNFETVTDARPTEENATRLRGYSYENASKATGKMPALPAFSCFVVALSVMKVGITSGYVPFLMLGCAVYGWDSHSLINCINNLMSS